MGLAIECNRISQMADSTKQAFSRLHGDDACLYLAGKLHVFAKDMKNEK